MLSTWFFCLENRILKIYLWLLRQRQLTGRSSSSTDSGMSTTVITHGNTLIDTHRPPPWLSLTPRTLFQKDTSLICFVILYSRTLYYTWTGLWPCSTVDSWLSWTPRIFLKEGLCHSTVFKDPVPYLDRVMTLFNRSLLSDLGLRATSKSQEFLSAKMRWLPDCISMQTDDDDDISLPFEEWYRWQSMPCLCDSWYVL